MVAVLLRLNGCNSFSHCHAMENKGKKKNKSEDRQFARFSDLPVWYFIALFPGVEEGEEKECLVPL